MNVKHIAVVFPSHRFATRDVAVGYEKAFSRLGLQVTPIYYDNQCLFWKNIWESSHVGEEMPRDVTSKVYERATGDVLFQLMRWQPELAVIIDGSEMHEIFWDWVGRLNVKTAIVMTENPYKDIMNSCNVSLCDIAFANDRISAQKMGIHYLPTAYDTTVHHPMIVSTKYNSDVCFVGSGFPERVQFLKSVDWDGIDFKMLGHWNLSDDHPLARFNDQDGKSLPNPETACYYCGSKLVLNLDRTSIDFMGHSRIERRLSCGPRIYEAAACGCAILSPNIVPEIDELLPDAYIRVNSPDELSEKVRYWVSDGAEQERTDLGNRARELIKPHSYNERAKELLRIVDRTL